MSRLAGTYLLGMEPFVVFDDDEGVAFAFAGVPRAYAARLVPKGDGFRLEGGQVDGAHLVFGEGDPAPGGVMGGVLEFERAPDDLELPGGRGLVPPDLELEPDEIAAFDRRLAEIRDDPDGGWLAVDPPRWRFVEWLTRQDAVIFHGSPRDDIDEFRTVRGSVELMDHGGKGNLAAVYGTPFGLWAMWFAVLDRSRLRGSIRNGVMRWTDRDARALDLYFFSVDHTHVGGDIWRSGTLYLLPRETFRASPFYPGGPDSSEWASVVEVRPLKRLAVEPEDFPFREDVGGHDDSELIRAEELSEVVLARARSASRFDDALEVALDWDDEVAEVVDEYLALTRKFVPDVQRRLTRDGDAATLEIRASASLLQLFEDSLSRRGIAVSARGRGSRSRR